MRSLEWGKFDEEYPDLNVAANEGASLLIFGNTANNEQSQAYNGADVQISCSGTNNARSAFIEIALDAIRGLLGPSPVLLQCKLWGYTKTQAVGMEMYWRMMFRIPDMDDCSNRYQDKTSLITWTKDGYAPLPGTDVELDPFETQNYSAYDLDTEQYSYSLDITDQMQIGLRSGSDLYLTVWPKNVSCAIVLYWNTAGKRPYLEFYYYFPVEIFGADATGAIDLSDLITPTDRLYLGAVEREETSTSVKAFVKNLSSETHALVEVWDDGPEWSLPRQSAGSGTGDLDYVTLVESAVSQKYTVKFSSSTAFEVKAEAYRNNIESLHPTYDADASWQGTTASTWTAPEGGFSLPSTAWQPGTLVNDEFVIYVDGNTTDTDWPEDSNDQVEITNDNAGVADSTNWRPVNGRRTRTTASTTIDATTKKIPVRAIVESQWPVGNRAWIGDVSNVNEGSIKSTQSAEIGTLVFTGSGVDDIHVIGNYNGTWENTLRILINAGDNTKFDYSYDGGSTWEATAVAIPIGAGNAVSIGNGMYVYADAGTHTSGDYWDSAIQPFAIELENLTANSNVYAAGTRLATTLLIQNLEASVWAQTTADSGVSESPASRIYLDDPASAGFGDGDTVFIQGLSADVSEEAEISAVESTYIDLTANLTEDYPEGAFVTKVGSGEEAFWLRIVAEALTDEEQKLLRLNVRI